MGKQVFKQCDICKVWYLDYPESDEYHHPGASCPDAVDCPCGHQARRYIECSTLATMEGRADVWYYCDHCHTTWPPDEIFHDDPDDDLSHIVEWESEEVED